MANKIKPIKLYRVGIIVKSIEEKLEWFGKCFDVDLNKKVLMDSSKVQHEPYTFNGEPCDFQTKVCIFPMAGIEIELIEPLDDLGPYAEWLREHGEGVQHFNIEVDDNNNFMDVMDELGANFLTGGSGAGISWKYYDTRKNFGTILEICTPGKFDK